VQVRIAGEVVRREKDTIARQTGCKRPAFVYDSSRSVVEMQYWDHRCGSVASSLAI
jgi:hypothetical protein